MVEPLYYDVVEIAMLWPPGACAVRGLLALGGQPRDSSANWRAPHKSATQEPAEAADRPTHARRAAR